MNILVHVIHPNAGLVTNTRIRKFSDISNCAERVLKSPMMYLLLSTLSIQYTSLKDHTQTSRYWKYILWTLPWKTVNMFLLCRFVNFLSCLQNKSSLFELQIHSQIPCPAGHNTWWFVACRENFKHELLS